MSRFSKLSHVIWLCQYHIVWVPKYRYRILKDKVGYGSNEDTEGVYRKTGLSCRGIERASRSCSLISEGAPESIDIETDGDSKR